MIKKNYDNIVYGASVAGVVYAVKMAEKGNAVLLMNKYGFPGGSITESLNCFQKLPYNSSTILSRILKKIRHEKLHIFYEEEDHVILNPEVVKIALQKELEESGVDLLFHVIPGTVSVSNEKITAGVIGKEGEMDFATTDFIDASGAFQFNFLNGEKREILSSSYFFFTTVISDQSFLPEIQLNYFKKLNDGRFFISLPVSESEPSAISEKSQQVLDIFSKAMPKGRVQLVPAQPFINFTCSGGGKSYRIISAESAAGKNFSTEEELIKAAELERALDEKG